MAISGNPLVTVKVAADDTELQAGLGRGKAGVKAFADEAKAAAEKTAASWESTSRKVGASLLAFSGAMAAFGASVGKEAAGFEQAMRYVNTSAGLADSSLAALSKTVLDLSVSLGGTKGPQEMAKGLYQIYGAGLKGAEAMEVLKVSTKLATIGMTDVAGATRALTEVMEAYHLSADKATIIGDQIMATVKVGRMQVEDYGNALPGVALKTASLGMSTEELGASMAIVSRSLPSSEAGTGVEKLLMALAAPTERGGKQLRSLGVDFGRTAIETKGFINVMLDLRKAVDGSDAATRKALQTSPGWNAFMALTTDGGKAYKAMLDDITRSHGTLDATMKDFMKGAIPQWLQLKVLAEKSAISFGTSLLPAFKSVVAGAKDFLTTVNSLSDAQKSQVAQGALMAVGVTGLAGAFLVLAPAIAAVPAALGVMLEALPVAAGIAAAVIAVGGAAAGLRQVWVENWGGIKDTTTEAVTAVQNVLKDTWSAGLIEAQGVWKSVSGDLMQGAQEVKKEFLETWPTVRDSVAEAWGVIGPGLKFMGKMLKDEIPIAVAYLAESFKLSWTVAKDVVGTAWTAIKLTLDNMSMLLKGTVTTFSALVAGDWKGAWQAFSGMVHDEAVLAYSFFKQMLQRIADLFIDSVLQFGRLGERMKDAFLAGLRGESGEFEKVWAEMQGSASGQFGNWVDAKALAGSGQFGSWADPKTGHLASQAYAQMQPTMTRYHRDENHGLVSGGVDEKHKRKSHADIEAEIRERIVKAAESYVGKDIREIRDAAGNLGASANKCADTVRAIGNAAGIRFGIATPASAVDGEAVRRHGYSIGPDHADSIPGKMISQSQVKPGDLALFKNTDRHFGPDVVTHVGIVIDPGKGIMVDASSGQKQVVKRNVNVHGPGSFYGYMRPDAIDEASGKRHSGGSGVENYANEAKRYETEMKRTVEEATDLILQQHRAARKSMAEYKKDMEEAYNWGNETLHRLASQEDAMSRDRRANYAFENEMGRSNIKARIAEIQAEMDLGLLSATARIENMRELHGLHQQQVREQIDSARFLREMGQIDDADLLLRMQQARENFVGSDQEKRALTLETHRLMIDLQNEQFAASDAIAEGMGSNLQSFMQNTITGQQTFGAAFTGLWKGVMGSIVQEISKAIVKALALKAIMRGIFSFFGGIFGGLFGGITTVGTAAEVTAMDTAGSGFSAIKDVALPEISTAHTGGLVIPGGIRTFHQGGLVDIGLGLRNDEVLAKLQTGEMVLSRQHLARARANEARQSGSRVEVNFHGGIHMNAGEDPADFTDRLGRDLAFRIQGL